VTAALHDDPATRDIPVVAVSAHPVSEDDRQRLTGKTLRVLTKDGGELHELAAAIGNLVGYPSRQLEPVT
jgi:CheY-like chemotaxis protein